MKINKKHEAKLRAYLEKVAGSNPLHSVNSGYNKQDINGKIKSNKISSKNGGK